MAIAWTLSGIVLLYYCVKTLQKPGKPNWNKAFTLSILWPLPQLLSLFSGKEKP